MRKLTVSAAAIVFFLMLAGCDSGPKPAGGQASRESKPEFQATHYTGREAFQKMYIAARSWAPDAKPFRLESQPTKGVNGHDGKAGVWRAGFASPGRRSMKSFVWSGIKSDDAPEPGISSSTEDSYSPSNSSTQVFDIAFLKTDSDKAFEAAQQHGGEKLTKQDPELPVHYALDWDSADGSLIWHVIYGGNGSGSKLRVTVDASTGQFLRVKK